MPLPLAPEGTEGNWSVQLNVFKFSHSRRLNLREGGEVALSGAEGVDGTPVVGGNEGINAMKWFLIVRGDIEGMWATEQYSGGARGHNM